MDLVIIGANGAGRELLSVLDAQDQVPGPLLGFLDDDGPDDQLVEAVGERVLGPVDLLAELDATYLISAVGPREREHLDERGRRHAREPLPRLVHPTAAVGRHVRLGPGAVLCAHATITGSVEAGRHLYL